MNIYLVERADIGSYDEYTAFVVKCHTEDEARKTHPAADYAYDNILTCWCDDTDGTISVGDTMSAHSPEGVKIIGTTRYNRQGWIKGHAIGTLKIKHIGVSNDIRSGVILSSYING